jgi:hypothetical protein
MATRWLHRGLTPRAMHMARHLLKDASEFFGQHIDLEVLCTVRQKS